MDSLNPNHPVTQAMSHQWHKIVALLMHKQNTDHVVITLQDLRNFTEDKFISIEEQHDGLHISLVSALEAVQLARKHGGLPT